LRIHRFLWPVAQEFLAGRLVGPQDRPGPLNSSDDKSERETGQRKQQWFSLAD